MFVVDPLCDRTRVERLQMDNRIEEGALSALGIICPRHHMPADLSINAGEPVDESAPVCAGIQLVRRREIAN